MFENALLKSYKRLKVYNECIYYYFSRTVRNSRKRLESSVWWIKD